MKTEPLSLLFLAAPILAVFSCQPQETPSEKPPVNPPLIAFPLFDYSAEESFKEAYAQMNEKDKKAIRQAVLRAASQVNVVFREGKFDKGSLLIQWETLYGQEVHPAIKKSGPGQKWTETACIPFIWNCSTNGTGTPMNRKIPPSAKPSWPVSTTTTIAVIFPWTPGKSCSRIFQHWNNTGFTGRRKETG